MKRIVLLVTVALVMALMVALAGGPSFAQGSPCGELVPGLAHSGPQAVGSDVRGEAGPRYGLDVVEFCNPA